jgi:N6-L-threonylcarbamoyladenine synthase
VSQKEPVILGIESSCDDTSAAILKNETILSNVIAGQEVHKRYGGVVPELASRAHMQHILPVVDSALNEAGVTLKDLDAIAFTRGPGLMGSLVVGTSFAKSLALALNIPLVDVNHMHGHILAHFIDDAGTSKPKFPFLCMTVSGGHTQIVLVRDYLDMEVVGQTRDDAAGEAFDKAAKMLGFEYPGGPLIDRYAQEGDSKRFTFSKPRVDGYDFSFSGLKTAILYFLQAETKKDPRFIEENKADLCASIQHTIIAILMRQLKRAAKDLGISEVAIAGGVSANSGLREALEATGRSLGWSTYIPKFEYCTDNAAMIAIAGRYLFEKGEWSDQSVVAQPRVPFSR